jgi:hypothetical protein
VCEIVCLIASAWISIASGSSTVAALGVLIPVVLVAMISAVPIYFRLSERRRRRQGERELREEGAGGDLAAEVEQLRRQQSGASAGDSARADDLHP